MWVDFDEGFSKKNGGLVIGCEMFFNKDDYDVVDVDDHHNREYWIWCLSSKLWSQWITRYQFLKPYKQIAMAVMFFTTWPTHGPPTEHFLHWALNWWVFQHGIDVSIGKSLSFLLVWLFSHVLGECSLKFEVPVCGCVLVQHLGCMIFTHDSMHVCSFWGKRDSYFSRKQWHTVYINNNNMEVEIRNNDVCFSQIILPMPENTWASRCPFDVASMGLWFLRKGERADNSTNTICYLISTWHIRMVLPTTVRVMTNVFAKHRSGKRSGTLHKWPPEN